MKKPAKIEAPPPCRHTRAYEIGFRAKDRAVLYFCPDCIRVGVDVKPKE